MTIKIPMTILLVICEAINRSPSAQSVAISQIFVLSTGQVEQLKLAVSGIHDDNTRAWALNELKGIGNYGNDNDKQPE